MGRFKAAGTHFVISAFVVVNALIVVFFVWYPYPYYKTDGVWDVIKVLIAVDVVLGPLLTMVVFNKDKSMKELGRDLGVIGCCQIAALVYGMHTIHSGRPLYLVFATDRFDAIPAMEIDPQGIHDAEVRKKPFVGPKLVYAERPQTQEEREKLLFEVLDGAPDLERRPERYRDFATHVDSVLEKGIPIDQIMKPAENQARRAELEQFLHEHGGSETDYAYFPLKGRVHDMVIAVDKARKEVVGAIDLNPWVRLKPASSSQTADTAAQADAPVANTVEPTATLDAQ